MRLLRRLLLSVLLVCLSVAGWQWWSYGHRVLVADGAEAAFDVPRGQAGPQRLAGVLQQAGVPVSSWQLAAALRLRGDAAQIKAGNYLITGPATLQDVLGELVAGQQEKGRLLTLLEGWRMRDIRAALRKAPDLNDTLSALSDAEVMERLGVAGVSPEGRFAPDTYAYRPGSDDITVLHRALALQQNRLQAAWENRATDSPLKTPDELLTLASVVEKETGHELDRDMVASVFINRLKKGMPLQSDPTTIYGLGEGFDGNLRKKDLRHAGFAGNRPSGPLGQPVLRGTGRWPLGVLGRSGQPQPGSEPLPAQGGGPATQGDGSGCRGRGGGVQPRASETES